MTAADFKNVYITDKTGKKFWNTDACPMSVDPEIRNLKRHLENAKRNPTAYHFLDASSAVIMCEGIPVDSFIVTVEDEELLRRLFES